MYADDSDALSPYSAGSQKLLSLLSSWCGQYGIKFNPKKSVIIIAQTKEEQRQMTYVMVMMCSASVVNSVHKPECWLVNFTCVQIMLKQSLMMH